MADVDDIANLFVKLRPASGPRWDVETLVPDRLHISVGPQGEHTIFLEGTAASFSDRLPRLEGVEHIPSILSQPSGRTLAALKIWSRNASTGDRRVSHVASEMASALRSDPGLSNEQLLAKVWWILTLLGEGPGLLSHERRIGLVGELIVLAALLDRASMEGIAPVAALERWTGPRGGLRDFAAEGVAIEVKTTSHDSRTHRIARISQLEPQGPMEKVYVCSVAVRREPSSPMKLSSYIQEILDRLIDGAGQPDLPARAAFMDLLLKAGYEPAHAFHYELADGFSEDRFDPGLFPAQQLPRLTAACFKPGEPPGTVSNIQYDLEITQEPLDPDAAESVYSTLLRGRALKVL